jgi:HD superfamily phosphohydrolase YqeK
MHDRFRDINNEELNNLIDQFGIDGRYKNNNALAHGPVAAAYANAYIINKCGTADTDIINAIKERNVELILPARLI